MNTQDTRTNSEVTLLAVAVSLGQGGMVAGLLGILMKSWHMVQARWHMAFSCHCKEGQGQASQNRWSLLKG